MNKKKYYYNPFVYRRRTDNVGEKEENDLRLARGIKKNSRVFRQEKISLMIDN